jgi:hypothetical protein
MTALRRTATWTTFCLVMIHAFVRALTVAP